MALKALYQKYTEGQQEQVLPMSVYDFESHLKKITHINKESVDAPIVKFSKENHVEKYVGYLLSNKFVLRPTRNNPHNNLSLFLCEGSYERHGDDVKVCYTVKPEPQRLRFLASSLIFWAVVTSILSYFVFGILAPIVCLLFLCFFLVMPYVTRVKLAMEEFESDLK